MKGFKRKILIFTFIFMPITFSLGLWQLDRADEKRNILATFDQLVTKAPANLDDELLNWQPITAQGRYTDLVLYEDNALLDGKAGFRIYHLFETLDDKYIFIHRGFVERQQIKNDLPIVSIPQGDFVLTGNKLEKNKNPFVQNTAEENPLIIQEFNLDQIVDNFNYLKNKLVYAFLFNLNPSDINKFKSIEKPINMTTEKHLGYAIQWFGLFAILLIMTLVIGLRRDEK